MKILNNPYVTQHKYGILIHRGIPVTEFVKIGQQMPKEAVLNAGISNHYDMAACMGIPEDLKKWEAEIAEEIAPLSAEKQYLEGTDWGLSSMTMFSALADNRANRDSGFRKLGSFGGSTPADTDDFGRCHRLLEKFPAWRERLAEVAKAFPDTQWKQLVPHWEDLTKLYLDDQRKALYDQINKLTRSPEIS